MLIPHLSGFHLDEVFVLVMAGMLFEEAVGLHLLVTRHDHKVVPVSRLR